jgi:bacterioferritin
MPFANLAAFHGGSDREQKRLATRGAPVDKAAFIDKLNEDLEFEYRSIVQYVQHIASIKGAEYQSTLDELSKHVRQELDHALTLARQIDFLGGVPSTRVPEVPAATDARGALSADLALEEQQLARYRERVEQAEVLSLPDVAETLAPLLQQTQEHVRDLRAALG